MDSIACHWDEARAERLMGATVLVGITHDEAAERRVEHFVGTVVGVSRTDGIILALHGSREGETCRLPADLDAFRAVAKGDTPDADYVTDWIRTTRRTGA
ncbi:hypothetical protein LA66_05355 [Aureimonas altamirensis]|uniref:Uncharacterized protein n=1 Tax=Aureimonas altamirensis TaxID=370622 RepID=A0A0B1Q9J2_9HYPH|nr:hypothetical protein [Aureimonas altamirensis]KHJ56041.1 hypothetical protein LA66_05355 [Aureimonas altamirensis]